MWYDILFEYYDCMWFLNNIKNQLVSLCTNPFNVFSHSIHLTTYFSDAWIPEINEPGQYLQVQFPTLTTVYELATQGANGTWVSSFKLSYSNDSIEWFTYKDGSGNDKIYHANSDDSGVVNHLLDYPTKLVLLRIEVMHFQTLITLRLAIYGKPEFGWFVFISIFNQWFSLSALYVA